MSSTASDDINSPSQTQQLATRLIRGNNHNKSNALPIKTCIAVAGGGSTASSAIASTSGASSLLLESIVTYDRRSFAEFVTNNHCDVVFNNSSDNGDNVDEMYPTDTGGGSNINYQSNSFSFCSSQAAILLAQAALSRSIQLSPRFQDRALYCVGVGCASALVGNTESNDSGDDTKKISTAYIALSTLRKGTTVWKVKLENCHMIKSSDKRSRGEEEMVISNLVLASMIQYKEGLEKDEYDGMIQQILDKDGDELTVHVNGNAKMETSPAAGARQIIQGDANIVSILPVLQKKPNNNVDCSQQISMETALADSQNPFPNDVIIVPGSYNPPHHGHVGLANAAVKALQQIRRTEEKKCNESSSSSNMLRSRYSSLESFSTTSSTSSSALKNIWQKVDKYTYPTVLFEMSVTNADKPPLDPSEVERRVSFFPSLSDMPKDWGVILTNAPLFSQKTSLLEEVLNCTPFSNRKMTFVLGTDTFVRIINPKYYNNSVENMIDALVEMKEKGVHFIVGGRLEQTESAKKFINGEEEVKSLPMHVQEMFTLLTEEEFRLDVSSTEIRKQMEER
jgi:nicotinic acid mononucleotide adenylyltransferase